jgi:hypothetical protein
LHRVPCLVHGETRELEIEHYLCDDDLSDVSPLIVLIQNHIKGVKNVLLKVQSLV